MRAIHSNVGADGGDGEDDDVEGVSVERCVVATAAYQSWHMDGENFQVMNDAVPLGSSTRPVPITQLWNGVRECENPDGPHRLAKDGLIHLILVPHHWRPRGRKLPVTSNWYSSFACN